MIRKIVEINEEKCNGCGACVHACHEKAIVLENGKAKLIKDDYCDGLGDCLPHCPCDAIRIVLREACEYVEVSNKEVNISFNLTYWPCQLRLASVTSNAYAGAHILLAADCTAYAYANFHNEFMNKRITLIGCPKLDNFDYSIKLRDILSNNDIKSITLIRMEVPCCGGLEMAMKRAIAECGKEIPNSVRIISTTGEVIKCY